MRDDVERGVCAREVTVGREDALGNGARENHAWRDHRRGDRRRLHGDLVLALAQIAGEAFRECGHRREGDREEGRQAQGHISVLTEAIGGREKDRLL